jgi:hypothetical protein
MRGTRLDSRIRQGIGVSRFRLRRGSFHRDNVKGARKNQIRSHLGRIAPGNPQRLTVGRHNDACDSLASEYLRDYPHGKPQIPWNPDSKCMMYVEGTPVNRRLKLLIREAATKWEMLKHIDNRNRHRWNSESRSLMIDWDSHGKATAGLPRTQLMTITKFKNELLAVNTRLAERTPGIPSKCASCQTEDETDDHLYTCLARPIWKKKTLEGLDLLMDKLETNADISFLLRFAIRSVIDPLWKPQLQAARPQLDKIVASQEAIGWDNLLRGFFSPHWSTLQEAHYRRTSPSDFTK